ncbi:Crp/Fnr family transcriptional regulator [Dietzia cinnamea]|uniref:Crp/Fnr family transcriptional regulator n=1 Tax=Dietzia cinnamea TaxID=321318 RepID=UPI00223C4843|nr:cyclic nucleotide-binding domain-containing protein [Dietzia cinnamea]MCT2032646.1 cyclic nucleotide-binding domain-containing protein [Dietzia cinnamea]
MTEIPGRRRTPLRPTCARPHACSIDVRLAVLHRTPFFADLDADGIAEVDRRAVSLSWGSGDAVYTEGERSGYLYVIAHGRAKAYRDSEDGRTVVVDLLAPGDFAGGVDSLGTPRYGETVEAIDTLCALRIGAEDFRDLLTRFPQVALRVIDHLTGLLEDARTTVTRHCCVSPTSSVRPAPGSATAARLERCWSYR